MKKLGIGLLLLGLGLVGFLFAQAGMGIDCTTEQQCKLNIYQTLGIKQSSNQDPTSVGLFLQDIVLSMTFFIGTLVTIVIIYGGLMYIRSGIKGDETLQATAKKGILGGFIGLLLVLSSYVIIRLIQFIVRGG